MNMHVADSLSFTYSLCKPRSNVSIRFPYSIDESNSKINSGVRRNRIREPISERIKPEAFTKAFSVSSRSRSLPKVVI